MTGSERRSGSHLSAGVCGREGRNQQLFARNEVECVAGVSKSNPVWERAAESLAGAVMAYICASVTVIVHPAGTLERFSGKAVRVRDLRNVTGQY